VRELTATDDEPWVGRLRYAFADALLAAGRKDEAREWFARAAQADEDSETDAAERLLELDGVVLDDVDTIDGTDQDETDQDETVPDGTGPDETGLHETGPDGAGDAEPENTDADDDKPAGDPA
jgi:hypothetical protein